MKNVDKKVVARDDYIGGEDKGNNVIWRRRDIVE